jgi:NAD(P)-dependent dehydrogenase (short-subunit alcohol dehydrogenase family)
MTEISDQRVVITGASEGLGLAMAKALMKRGARVTAIARDSRKLAAAECAGADAVAGDATDGVLMNRVVAEQRPDALILNAGARLPMGGIDALSWEEFSAAWNVDVKAGFVGIQAALKTPMKPGGRVLVMSSGAAMVLSLPAIHPDSLRLSGGYVGAKRMLWFMAHSANSVSRERGLGVRFQVLVPGQLIGSTALGRQVAAAYARLEGISPEEHILRRYGSMLAPEQVGEQVADLLSDSRYANGVAYGFRAGADIVPLDVAPATAQRNDRLGSRGVA